MGTLAERTACQGRQDTSQQPHVGIGTVKEMLGTRKEAFDIR